MRVVAREDGASEIQEGGASEASLPVGEPQGEGCATARRYHHGRTPAAWWEISKRIMNGVAVGEGSFMRRGYMIVERLGPWCGDRWANFLTWSERSVELVEQVSMDRMICPSAADTRLRDEETWEFFAFPEAESAICFASLAVALEHCGTEFVFVPGTHQILVVLREPQIADIDAMLRSPAHEFVGFETRGRSHADQFAPKLRRWIL